MKLAILPEKDKVVWGTLKTTEEVNTFLKGQARKPFARKCGLSLPFQYLAAVTGGHNANGSMGYRCANTLLLTSNIII